MRSRDIAIQDRDMIDVGYRDEMCIIQILIKFGPKHNQSSWCYVKCLTVISSCSLINLVCGISGSGISPKIIGVTLWIMCM